MHSYLPLSSLISSSLLFCYELSEIAFKGSLVGDKYIKLYGYVNCEFIAVAKFLFLFPTFVNVI